MSLSFDPLILNASTTFVPISEANRFVSIEMCQSFVEGTKGWNTIYQVLIVCLLVLYFYNIYRQGGFKKEISYAKKVFKNDEEEEENG